MLPPSLLQFLLREGDVGLDRAAVSATRLGELNENAHVQAVQGPLTTELLKSTEVRVTLLCSFWFYKRPWH